MRVIRYRWMLCPLSTVTHSHAHTLRRAGTLVQALSSSIYRAGMKQNNYTVIHVNHLSYCVWINAACCLEILGWTGWLARTSFEWGWFTLCHPHALIIASCVFKPQNIWNLKEQWLYVVIIDRIERQVSAALKALTSKLLAQLGLQLSHSRSLALALFFIFISLMSSSCSGCLNNS